MNKIANSCYLWTVIGFVFSILISCASIGTYAQTAKDTLTEAGKDTNVFKMKVLPLPTLYYTPETKTAFGILNLFLFRVNTSARVSAIDFSIVYTQRKQLLIDPTYTIFTHNENYIINGGFVYSKFPDYFFGVGNNQIDQTHTREFIAYKTIQFHNRILRKVHKRWFAGLQYQFYKVFDVHFDANSQYNEGNVAGFRGSTSSGLGLILLYDSRDNVLSASRGGYLEFSNLYYNSHLGGNSHFHSYKLDLRKYYTLTKKFTLATQVLVTINEGETPFKQMAQLGGNRTLRGYYTGRFRDNHAWVIQGELRYFLFPRVGFAVFGGVGKVASKLGEMAPTDVKGAVGGGIRVRMLRKQNFSIRLDVASGRKSNGFYVSVAEAF
ncbi:BamA/TamA family outer membrane protein [Cytophagaceae bacterium YF14B1]|uniref:BamA/TamA family outer membrane protein n=1 Tax=Xanthocytophaga flava TaxID=3048013 RepID=A0AAE3U7C0_9BACT|nr:BamA/TamA family outer membrane protein [Xanthocytophaga flavus]MDJ1482774.1 BamA/TamA family outer membrane protein [Xanthocytophaga flavus]